MTMSVLNIAARRILRITLVLAPALAANVAVAQNVPPPYGNYQSPINIIEPVPLVNAPTFVNTSDLQQPRDFTLKNTTGSNWCHDVTECQGTVDQRWGSLKAYPPPAPEKPIQIQFGASRYTLQEFHFHAPAEHLVNGVLTEMEVHFVFKKNEGQACSSDEYLVIGQRIMKGAPNSELNKIFGGQIALPTRYGLPAVPLKQFTIGKVLTNLNEGSYRYSGSLTAPADLGCIPPGNPIDQLASGYLPEVVSWVLLEPTLQMSGDQIACFRVLFPNGDARGPQAIKSQRVGKTRPPVPVES